MDYQLRSQFCQQLLSWFGADYDAFRLFVRDLPDGAKLSQQLPPRPGSMEVLVSETLDLLLRGTDWETIAPMLFFTLRQRLQPWQCKQIAYWERQHARARDGGVERGEYAVVLVHDGGAGHAALADQLSQSLDIASAEAARRVARLPAEVANGLSAPWALSLGRTFERLGAIVSFVSPPTGRPLPRLRRSPTGCVLALVPAQGAGMPFWLMCTPVTQELFLEVMKKNPSQYPGRPRAPVDSVSRDDALEFCEALSLREGLTSAPYRLPTEAEWERAARAGEETRFPGGNNWREVAFAVDGAETQPVRGRKANGWGFYDMAGNVWEWVVETEDQDGAPRHPAFGILKGGAFDSPEAELFPSARRRCPPRQRQATHGLRPARSVTVGEDGDQAAGDGHDRQ